MPGTLRPRKKLHPNKKFHLYNTRRWRRKSREHLKANPWCVECLKEGKHVVAKICDHVIPHNEDPHVFWYGDLQSLCATHDSAMKQRSEIRGYSTQVGVDGWPVDPLHPANNHEKPVSLRRRGRSAIIVNLPEKMIY